MENPKVIVLILSYNGKYLLNDSVTSYLNNDYKNFEVVIIDNGSTDGTKEYVEKKWKAVTIIRTEKNLGYSGGFNFGLDFAFNREKADYVIVTNNDVVADKYLIKELVLVAQKKETIGFVTGKVYYYDNPTVFQTVGKKEDPVWWNGGHIGGGEKDIGQYDEERELAFADDVFTLVSRALYNKIGGYDETFFLQSEEYDWQARAKNVNFSIFYTPKAMLWHKESMTIGKTSAIKEYYNSRNSMLVVLKNKESEFFRNYFRNYFFYRIVVKSIKCLLKLEIKKSLFIWTGFFSGIRYGIVNNRLTLRHFI